MKRVFMLLVIVFLVGCSEPYPAADQEIGVKGEPPKALVRAYHQQFQAADKHYVLALGFIHAFLVEQGFSVNYTRCFDDVLDVTKRTQAGFSCIALQAEQGPPTKVYVRVVIDEVLFNQLDGNNRLLLSVELFALKGYLQNGTTERLIDAFDIDVARVLSQL
ncbi:hypothetical protein [Amphritea sp.]|uniref:hypothetical protein n=1 Tax=Amphritea sp. TaxID=1872502 RepID=UPI003A8E26D0